MHLTTYEPESGMTIYHAAEFAVATARRTRGEVEFIFNDIRLIAHPLSFADDIAHIYHLKCALRRYQNNP
jgi:hypothetical protein